MKQFLANFIAYLKSTEDVKKSSQFFLVYTLGFSEKSHDLVYGMTCEDENYKMIIIITITYKN